MSPPVRVHDARHLHLDRHGPVDAPGVPVLLLPPPAAPASCYHLRPGLSLRDHLVAAGHPVHVLDFGRVTRADRDLGFTRLVDTILPTAVHAASADVDRPVVVLGWSIAGTLALFALAAHPDLPVAGAVVIGAPFDYTHVPHLRPVWRLRQRLAGNHDRLAHADAVEQFTREMPAYPGRFFTRLWADLMVRNEVVDGRLRIAGRDVDLATLPDQPILAIGSPDDVITPLGSAAHLVDLVPWVRLATAPGSHLGVLTGTTAPETTWRHLDAFLAELSADAGRR